jgi:hypothetical protein
MWNAASLTGKQGPAIFSLLFAAIVTGSLRVVGRFVCQQGAKLGVSLAEFEVVMTVA